MICYSETRILAFSLHLPERNKNKLKKKHNPEGIEGRDRSTLRSDSQIVRRKYLHLYVE